MKKLKLVGLYTYSVDWFSRMLVQWMILGVGSVNGSRGSVDESRGWFS